MENTKIDETKDLLESMNIDKYDYLSSQYDVDIDDQYFDNDDIGGDECVEDSRLVIFRFVSNMIIIIVASFLFGSLSYKMMTDLHKTFESKAVIESDKLPEELELENEIDE